MDRLFQRNNHYFIRFDIVVQYFTWGEFYSYGGIRILWSGTLPGNCVFYKLHYALPYCIFQLIFSKLSMDYEENTANAMKNIRITYFWSNDFLIRNKKRHFNYRTKFANMFHIVKWLLAVAMLIIVNETPNFYPEFLLYSKDMPIKLKTLYKLAGYTTVGYGIYISVCHECQYSYGVLHNHFQMEILTEYIRQEMQKYKTMKFVHKIQSNVYQSEIREILKRSIAQYNILRMSVREELIHNCNSYVFQIWRQNDAYIQYGCHMVFWVCNYSGINWISLLTICGWDRKFLINNLI